MPRSHQALFVGEQAYDKMKPSINSISDAQARVEVGRWIQNLCRVQADALRTASKFSEAALAARDRMPGNSEHEFKVNDWVLTTWRGGPPDKLSVRLPGPYKVLKKLSDHTYLLQDPADDSTRKRHAAEMFVYHLRDQDDPVDIIAMDEEEEIVGSVVDHHRVVDGSKLISDLDFRVRFKNQPASEDRWFSHREITRKKGLKAYWDYVEQHPELNIRRKE